MASGLFRLQLKSPESFAVLKIYDFISDSLIDARNIYAQLTGPTLYLYVECANIKDILKCSCFWESKTY